MEKCAGASLKLLVFILCLMKEVDFVVIIECVLLYSILCRECCGEHDQER